MNVAPTSVDRAVARVAESLVASRLAALLAAALTALCVVQALAVASLARRTPDRVVVADAALLRPFMTRCQR